MASSTASRCAVDVRARAGAADLAAAHTAWTSDTTAPCSIRQDGACTHGTWSHRSSMSCQSIPIGGGYAFAGHGVRRNDGRDATGEERAGMTDFEENLQAKLARNA